MSKSLLSAMALVLTLLIMLCIFFSMGAAQDTVATLTEEDGLIASLSLTLHKISPDFIKLFLFALVGVIVIDLLNIVCKSRIINLIVLVLDVVIFAACFLIFSLTPTIITWAAISLSLVLIIIAAVFSRAQLYS